MYVLGSGSSLVGSGSAFFTLGLQNAGTTDLRALMIGGSGTNENNLNFEAYSGGTVLMGAANSYAGRTNIGRAIIEASVIANAGVVSSLGTGSSSPAIVMNDTTSTSATVSTLRYIGSADASTDREIQLFTNGTTMPSLAAGVENNGTGSLKFTSAFTVAGDTTLARTFRLSGTNTGANEIVSIGQTATSVLTLDKAGSGTWALTGDSTYTGGTTVSNGTLQLGNGGTAGNVGSGNIAISSGATLRTNRSNTVEITNVITGSGNVVVANSGAGVTKLSSNANTYSGGTTVSSGTLMVTNTSGSATGTGAVTVMNGATLAGSGRIAPAADTSIMVCGTLAVGESASSASLLSTSTSGAGALVLDGGSTLAFHLLSGYGLGDNTSSPARADLLSVGGTLQINPGAIFRVNAASFTGYASGDQWKLIDWSTLGGTASGTFTTFDLPTLDGGLIWNTSMLYTLGTISIVPEPSRAGLILLGLAAAVLRRRR